MGGIQERAAAMAPPNGRALRSLCARRRAPVGSDLALLGRGGKGAAAVRRRIQHQAALPAGAQRGNVSALRHLRPREQPVQSADGAAVVVAQRQQV